MFLKKLNQLSKKVSYKLTFAILLFFIPTYVLIFFAFDILATHHLERRDREQIESHLVEFLPFFVDAMIVLFGLIYLRFNSQH